MLLNKKLFFETVKINNLKYKEKKKMKLKKTMALVLSMLTLLSGAACVGSGNEEKIDSAQTLDIMCLNKGFGTKWLEALINNYKVQNPDITITTRYEIEDTIMTGQLELGLEYSKYDLFFTGYTVDPYIKDCLKGSSKALLADLTSLYNTEVDGEKIKDKIEPQLLKAYTNYKADGTEAYYTLPWIQTKSSLVVNNATLKKALGENWQETYPMRTTEEFLALCKALKSRNVSPFIYAGNNAYYDSFAEVLWAQYEGMENVDRFYDGLAWDEDQEKYRISNKIFDQEGRQKSLEVLAEMFDSSVGLCHKSSGQNWNSVQMTFMAEGEVGFLPCGDWLQGEMKNNFPNGDILMLKTPIISSLGEKLGITEAELIACVDYADGRTTQVPTVNPTGDYTADEVVEKVTEARRIVFSIADYHTAYVADYSLGKETAIDFLKYMISDEGQKIYAKAAGGLVLPYGYNMKEDSEVWASYDAYAKSSWNLSENMIFYTRHTYAPLGGAGLTPFGIVKDSKAGGPLEMLMYEYGKTPKQIYDYDINYYAGSAWTDLLRVAGLN